MVKRYASTDPGLLLQISDEKLADYFFKTYGRRTILFSYSSGSIYETDDKKIQDYIESTNLFKRKGINRIATPEEVKIEKEKQEQAKRLEFAIETFESGLLPLSAFDRMKIDELSKYAEKIGLGKFESREPAIKAIKEALSKKKEQEGS